MASNRIRRNINTPIVILDTSAVLTPFEFSIDIEQELYRLLGRVSICIPQSVFLELEQLYARNNSKTSQKAKAALCWIKRFSIIPTTNPGDAGVIEAAVQTKATVVTNDKELRRRLKQKHIPIITLRQNQYLVLLE